MLSQLVIAYLGGVVSVTAPCVLPLLPAIMGAVAHENKKYPLFLVGGFSISFASLGILFGTVGYALVKEREVLITTAGVVTLLFGVIYLFPKLSEKMSEPFAYLTGRLASKAPQANALHAPWEAALLGATLGVVWAPCAGPVLGSILALATVSGNIALSATLMIIYALGAATPMLALAYGGKTLATRVRGFAKYAPTAQRLFGLVLIISSLFILFNLWKRLEILLTPFAPNWITVF
ncbi:cytochrome c biogenesis protein CcdA [Patescibacteria group bacterium]|nr:cytochrome c biogenesis protein CcdA [Patescibacteria group bacterium]